MKTRPQLLIIVALAACPFVSHAQFTPPKPQTEADYDPHGTAETQLNIDGKALAKKTAAEALAKIEGLANFNKGQDSKTPEETRRNDMLLQQASIGFESLDSCRKARATTIHFVDALEQCGYLDHDKLEKLDQYLQLVPASKTIIAEWDISRWEDMRSDLPKARIRFLSIMAIISESKTILSERKNNENKKRLQELWSKLEAILGTPLGANPQFRSVEETRFLAMYGVEVKLTDGSSAVKDFATNVMTLAESADISKTKASNLLKQGFPEIQRHNPGAFD